MPRLALAGLFVALIGGGSANAALVTETYVFTFGGFVDAAGGPDGPIAPPITTISGSFTITFDPDAATSGAEVVTHSFSPGLFAPPLYFATYLASGATPLRLAVGDVQSDPGNVYFGADNFGMGLVLPTPGTPELWPCGLYGSDCYGINGYVAGYTLASHPDDFWVATTGSVSAVPEPTVWTLTMAGFGAVGLLAARRRRPTASAA